MNKLTKKYKVVAKDGLMLWPLTEDGYAAEVYPGVGTLSFESDSYEEALAFVKANNLVYVEPESDEV